MTLKTHTIILLLVFSPYLTFYGQQIQEIVALGSPLSESSGLIFINQKLITHNDSQGESALYELDSLTGQFDRKVIIENASNIDWEDLACDNDYIYIGDFGNNSGDRTDLIIYRISLQDYWNTPNDTVFADSILLSYANQTSFTNQQNATNYDCEAITVIGDSLYLFSKNWLNQKTYVYVLPKDIGNYSLQIRDSIAVQGLITSADFNTVSNRLILTGNTPFAPFIIEMDWNATVPISQLSRNRYTISVPGSIQVEAVASISENSYYLTSEAFFGNSGSLLRLDGGNGSLFLENYSLETAMLFPNPITENFQLQFKDPIADVNIYISNLLGEVIFQMEYFNTDKIQLIAPQTKGTYILTILSNTAMQKEKIIVQ